MRKIEGCPLPTSQIGGSQVLINAETGKVGSSIQVTGFATYRDLAGRDSVMMSSRSLIVLVGSAPECTSFD